MHAGSQEGEIAPNIRIPRPGQLFEPLKVAPDSPRKRGVGRTAPKRIQRRPLHCGGFIGQEASGKFH